ncbi:MAG: hypothetical protein AAFR12_18180 [Cyanobacteria bacterium J06626_6]
MSLSNFSEPIVDRMTKPLLRLCLRWGVEPAELTNGLGIWAGWTGLTWLAFVSSLLFVEVGERSDLSLVEGLVGGGLIGLAQWLILRAHLQRAHRWVAATATSWGMLTLLHIGALGWMAPSTPNLFFRGMLGVLHGAYVGLGLGLGQWLAIRQEVSRAWRWVPISSGIWAMAIALGWTIGGELRAASNLFISEVVGLMVAWGAIAALSGIGIIALLDTQRVRRNR